MFFNQSTFNNLLFVLIDITNLMYNINLRIKKNKKKRMKKCFADWLVFICLFKDYLDGWLLFLFFPLYSRWTFICLYTRIKVYFDIQIQMLREQRLLVFHDRYFQVKIRLSAWFSFRWLWRARGVFETHAIHSTINSD